MTEHYIHPNCRANHTLVRSAIHFAQKILADIPHQLNMDEKGDIVVRLIETWKGRAYFFKDLDKGRAIPATYLQVSEAPCPTPDECEQNGDRVCTHQFRLCSVDWVLVPYFA